MSTKKSNRLYAIAMSVLMLQMIPMNFTFHASANEEIIQPEYTGLDMISDAGEAVSDDTYGLALDMPAFTMKAGEVRQICPVADANYFYPNVVIQSEDNDIALVFFDGHIFAQHAGETTVYIQAKLNPEKISLTADDDGIRKTTVKITVTDADDADLTDAQKAELEAVQRKEDGCRFPRKKAVIKGLLNADAPRLTLDAVNQIIAESDSFDALYRKLSDTHPYPDYWDGSGFTSVVYFLNDKGTERIRVDLACSGTSPHDIVYERLNQNGILEEARYLYPASRVDEHINADPNPPLKDWLYCFYHDISSGNLKGDTNNDGKVDDSDVVYFQNWLLCRQDTQDINEKKADINQDGKLNAIDFTLLKRQLIQNTAE